MSESMHDRNDGPRSSAPASGDPGYTNNAPPVVPQLDATRPARRPTGWSPTSWRSGEER
ncbi:MAG: hypothetical protein H6734_11560 [Alphaproteobacteria bacterium]|nr:hypothetical protein [Alphaproteobacteria bacterium]